MEKYSVQSTSKNSADINDIELRKTTSTRLIFRPCIVDNSHDVNANVRGYLIFEKKSKDGQWYDSNNVLNLATLKQGECVKLELKTESISRLLKRAKELQDLYKRFGIQAGEHNYVLTEENVFHTLEQLSKFENREAIINALGSLDEMDLQNLTSFLGISKLTKILDIWAENKDISDENLWQYIFEENPWVISQIFACPFIQIGTKFYCGGKEDDDKGGVKGDLLYKNNLTGNIAFVEIKTPTTKIIGSKYRGGKDGKENIIYGMSNDLTGGINQVLNQRKVYLNEHGDNNGKFLHNAKCVLVIGQISELKNVDEKKSFELYRSSIKDVEIITYDELFDRIRVFHDLLKA